MTPDSEDDVFQLDRRDISSSFDRAAGSYDAAAILQSQVRAELLERVAFFKLTPDVVVDLGAGTGHATRELKQQYKQALVAALDIAPGMLREAKSQQRLFRRFERVCADTLKLPLKDASVDIVFSNLMLQWCEPLDAAFAEVRRVLKPDGLFAFTTFGPDTLRELRAAWAQVDTHNHVNRFLDMHDVGDALMRAGFSEPVLDVEYTTLTYPDALGLMRDLKAIGAHNVTSGRARGLTGRHALRRMQSAYEAFREDGRDGAAGKLPATYEVIYGVTWGARGRPGAAGIGDDNEVRIPINAIRGRGRPQ